MRDSCFDDVSDRGGREKVEMRKRLPFDLGLSFDLGEFSFSLLNLYNGLYDRWMSVIIERV